jgi:hypothetical protein
MTSVHHVQGKTATDDMVSKLEAKYGGASKGKKKR